MLKPFTRSWDAAAYRSRAHTVASLRRDAVLIREWMASLQQVVAAQPAGCLQLETEALKATHLVTLKSALATVCVMLVSAARREGTRVLQEIQARVSVLKQRPSVLPDFITYTLAAAAARTERDSQLTQVAAVGSLYESVEAWGSRLPHNDQVLLDDVREAGRALARAVGEAAGFVESKRPGMAATLERQGRELGKRAQELLSDVERGTLRQRVSPTAVVLEEGELSRWRDSLAGLSGGLARVNEQEVQLGIKATQLHDLDEITRQIAEAEDLVAQAEAASGTAAGSDAAVDG
ncbi:hypothetical protein MNEG_1235 [Monoraphidium neglectum]|uniref:Uncharacterized protein n=1 Tax=Monoraphidium neglectum TaxID=145388 RepID=A0A0D2LK18_9CHLO|nr:hypothetical protein MNEG_1235 [Monoraphidium neglectum]KIZ06709.1 hypothetical protein MNEG_1235 [Monoraphidium neglectum]|eukprot:XP_013905728.1 hypothetical protein MNEG_1235 [Monoraphidium neglectum]